MDSVVLSGTQTVDSAELAEITDGLAHSTFNDDPEELQERIRAQFQDRGYFKATLEKMDIKVIDPLASPKPVRIEAQVSEGPRCRLSVIEFTGNHAVDSATLRAKLPLKTGDVFKRAKIAGGLEALRVTYTSRGFIDFYCIPNVAVDSNSTVRLTVEVNEGPQYHMGTLEIVGPSEAADKLQARWELPVGAIYDANYVQAFLEKNKSLLPEGFTEAGGVSLFPDCRDATVSVHLHLVYDADHAASDQTKRVRCPEEKRSSTAR